MVSHCLLISLLRRNETTVAFGCRADGNTKEVGPDLGSILIISDGKAGHLNQSLGLADALVRLRPGTVVEKMEPLSLAKALAMLVMGGQMPCKRRPAVIIGAGHGTHLTLLAFRRCLNVPAVVVMKPSLPLRLFDLCLVPEHDSPPSRSNVIATRGALNRMQPGAKKPGTGMILVGGPSQDSGWDEELLLGGIKELVHSDPRRWQLTTSRRTPDSTLEKLKSLAGVEVVPVGETAQDWLPRQLAITEQCWVTEDSVSMIYEALSAGCAVGVFEVPWTRGKSRLLQGIVELKKRHMVTSFSSWSGGALARSCERLNESKRCAQLIIERGWL
ncbi:mitochondrial fission ELM1 family protein [Marinobacter koreensis]|uniref:Mitochondrial fission ELM1 family protein n=2 Tax=Marinobacter koreensis TaxID=335974 RepID=A0ABW0RNI8_9GAMM|nr:ELM1/GtrOC1 family putative glycosyltransferase [Marinobacter koreensis]MCK7549773.1 mitochondrial fission ELM1 family protein [Marinobacter koreensis]